MVVTPEPPAVDPRNLDIKQTAGGGLWPWPLRGSATEREAVLFERAADRRDRVWSDPVQREQLRLAVARELLKPIEPPSAPLLAALALPASATPPPVLALRQSPQGR